MQPWFKWAPLILQISVMAQVFAIGLGTSWGDATFLFRRPKLLFNSILARNVAVPIIAIVLIKAFSFHVALAITLGLLAVTPVPPLLPKSQLKAGARSEYVLGLLTSQAVLAVVLVPVTIELMDWALGSQTHFSVSQVAALILKAILIPLAAGMLAGRLLPKLKQLAPPLLAAGTVLLIAGAIPLLVVAWKTFGTLAGNGAMLALGIFMVAGTAVGHLLGGPVAEDRTALAIATSWRHPGLAMAIAAANFPTQKMLVAGTLVIYLILRMILSIPYARWRHTALSVPRHPAPARFPPGFAGRRQ
jgi:bile acid:Na+ symporter, BASS family